MIGQYQLNATVKRIPRPAESEETSKGFYSASLDELSISDSSDVTSTDLFVALCSWLQKSCLPSDVDMSRVGLVCLSSDAGGQEFDDIYRQGIASRRHRVSAQIAPYSGLNAHTARASIDLGITGPGLALVSDEGSSGMGLFHSLLLLETGEVDHVMVAAADGSGDQVEGRSVLLSSLGVLGEPNMGQYLAGVTLRGKRAEELGPVDSAPHPGRDDLGCLEDALDRLGREHKVSIPFPVLGCNLEVEHER